MTIGEMLRQGFHYARTCKSLWLFGFFLGITSSGASSGSGGGQGGGTSIGAAGVAISTGGGLPFGISPVAIVIAIVIAAGIGMVMRLLSEGALIQGVVRSRHGGKMTTREGFRTGWAHVAVVLQILFLYVVATIGVGCLCVLPAVLAFRAFGPIGGISVAIPALLVAVPSLVTLYLVQAFALRIAVLENRHTLDAIRKARLFLHGRLLHGLKLIVAMFVGTMAIVVLGIAALVPLALMLRPVGGFPMIVLGTAIVVPAMAVLTAMAGTFRSSVWTIGYVSQVEAA